MQTLITIIHIIASVFLCLVILLQSGRGGGMGAAFGGASSQIFGGRGAGNFLSRLTTGAAIIFFITSLTLSMMSSRQSSVITDHQQKPEAEQTEQTTPPSAASTAPATAPDDASAAPANGPAPANAPASQPTP